MPDVYLNIRFSNEIGENIYENVTEAMEKKEELQAKYEELLSARTIGLKRLIKAFPGMKSKVYQESLNKIKQHINHKKNKTGDLP